MPTFAIDPLIAAAVVIATACTDAVYVLFTNAVVRRRRLPAASWSSIWYLLSSFAVINYTLLELPYRAMGWLWLKEPLVYDDASFHLTFSRS